MPSNTRSQAALKAMRRTQAPSADRAGRRHSAVDDRRHALHDLHDAFARHDALVQPVGDVLRGDAAGRAVFHEADVVDVGHFRATDALVDPAHDVAEYALRIVLEFGRDLGFATSSYLGASGSVRMSASLPRRPACAISAWRASTSTCVVVRRVQRGGCRARHPRARRAGLGDARSSARACRP